MIYRIITYGFFVFFSTINFLSVQAQDPWILKADNIHGHYYGETVANGAVGIVTSNTPFKIQDVVLARCVRSVWKRAGWQFSERF